MWVWVGEALARVLQNACASLTHEPNLFFNLTTLLQYTLSRMKKINIKCFSKRTEICQNSLHMC